MIKLTTTQGASIYVNPENIGWKADNESGGTIVQFDGETRERVLVTESYDEVCEMVVRDLESEDRP